jgi:outer membrane protein assembly factor BamB
MRYCVILLVATICVSLAGAADWPQWRGPSFNGSTDETGLPATWSRTEGIAWHADLPGCSGATPIIWQDRVFVSSTDTQRNRLAALCYDRATGKRLWQEDIAEGTHRDSRSTYAESSPVTDGKIVVFFYAGGQLVGFDLEGNRRWARNLQDDYGPFAFLWTFASSPTLLDGRLYVQVLQRDVPVQGRGLKDRVNESYLLAIDPETGKTLWRHIRPSEAQQESREAFSTPIPVWFEGKPQLVVAGGDAITGHNPQTGEELWRWGDWNPRRITHWRLVPSPVAGDGIVLACAPKSSPVYGIRLGGAGNLDDDNVAWISGGDPRDVSSDVPTPAYYDGDFFVLNDLRRRLSRVEPRTGKVKWTITTPGRAKYEASPLAADGRLYLINHAGEAAVIDVATGDVLHVIPMDNPAGGEVVRASISAAHGHLFLRTTRSLYCIGPGRPAEDQKP